MFEHVHPFADGNCRVGRLMVPLCTRWNVGSTSASAFLGEPVHANKDIYIDALKHGRRSGDLTSWTRTFLSFVRQAAEANADRLDRLEALKDEWRDRVDGVRSDSVAWRLLPWLLTHPASTVNQMRDAMGVGFPAANAAAAHLVKSGVLVVARDARRDRMFHAPDVLGIFDRFLTPSV